MNAVINPQLLLSFVLTATVILVIPGPSVMFIVGRAIAVGRTGAIAAAAGNTAGTSVQGILAVFGFGTLLGRSPILYHAVKLGGALYLMHMGIKMFKQRQFSTSSGGSSEAAGRSREARRGFVVGVSNPKQLLFFAAVLPQFIDPARGYLVAQMVMLLAVYTVMSLVSDTSWGMIGSSVRDWSANSPKRLELLVACGGVCIITVGVLLGLSHGV